MKVRIFSDINRFIYFCPKVIVVLHLIFSNLARAHKFFPPMTDDVSKTKVTMASQMVSQTCFTVIPHWINSDSTLSDSSQCKQTLY